LFIFQKLLNDGRVNNPLMQKIDVNGPATAKDRLIQGMMSELKSIVINIVRQFMDVLQKNKLLGVECLFRFTSREHKDSILSNYDSI